MYLTEHIYRPSITAAPDTNPGVADENRNIVLRIGSLLIVLQQDEAAQLASRLWDALAETRRAGQPTVELGAIKGTD